ncbi:MAG: hypothetical protein KW793_02985 [Candidatus Doudnabacteria bacterium]|nr:hypothetical protein [Candidatus Doudnabacteria bacterium]
MRIEFVTTVKSAALAKTLVPTIQVVEFETVLAKWSVALEKIEEIQLSIEVRDMIPEGAYFTDSAGVHHIVLSPRAFESQTTLNKVIAHELRHLWYTLKLGRNIGRAHHCWEELSCNRVEKTHQHTNFIIM